MVASVRVSEPKQREEIGSPIKSGRAKQGHKGSMWQRKGQQQRRVLCVWGGGGMLEKTDQMNKSTRDD